MLAIVPVKGRDGKHRLDGLLSADERERLVAAMLADVLTACERASAVADILVVTPDPGVVPEGVDVLVDRSAGHAEAIAEALSDPRARDGALVVMGDCPLVRAESLDRLAAAAQPVAVGPARDGGMNAIALRSPDALAPAFGVPEAATVTLERARAAGVPAAVVDDPSLAFDVDNPPDVWKIREFGPRGRAHDVVEEMLPPTGGLV